MSATSASRACVFALALLLAPALAGATEPPAEDRARIGEGVGHDVRGRIAVNQAAGSGNAQTNLAAIAFSAGGTGLVDMRASQHPATAVDRSRAAHAQIDDAAFAGSHGVLSINQVAGSGNAQANLFGIGQYPLDGTPGASAIDGLDDAALAAVAGDTPSGSTDTTVRIRQARIADEAFRGSQGVVQVNQTAGVGNLSTNAIVLQLPGGTP